MNEIYNEISGVFIVIYSPIPIKSGTIMNIFVEHIRDSHTCASGRVGEYKRENLT